MSRKYKRYDYILFIFLLSGLRQSYSCIRIDREFERTICCSWGVSFEKRKNRTKILSVFFLVQFIHDLRVSVRVQTLVISST